MALTRRAMLATTCLPWAACTPSDVPRYTGGWVGAQHERGHRLREAKSGSQPEPAVHHRANVIVVGAGIAGLAAARALQRAGVDDVHVFDLEDAAGGNSRGHVMAGMACPLGAHYLPLPGVHAVELIALLEELGLRTMQAGQPVYDERHLCHSPQERLFIAGQWHEGLLPPMAALPVAQRAQTLAQYRQFSNAVASVGQGGAFSMPTARSRWSPALDALDAITFAQWLDEQGLHAPALRWYLDYCCRDDYGAGAAQVSAWAGLHYFASRHGFHVPGDASGTDAKVDPKADPKVDPKEREGVLTWPEGNAWLSRRMAAPLRERLHTGQVALQVNEGRHDVSVDFWNAAQQRTERWTAAQVVLAVPLFVAARLLATPPAALTQAVAQMRHAPWLVANLQLDTPLVDPGGAPPSWDNVLYAPDRPQQPQAQHDSAPPAAPVNAALGYVDAMHQSTRPHAGPTVLTAYWALGGDSAAQLQMQRARLLNEPWSAWAQAVLQDLVHAHPDLPAKVKQVDLMRYGHAMSIPVPGVRSGAALGALARGGGGRVSVAHSDLSGYSVFEEALFHGHSTGQRLATQLRGLRSGAA